MTSIMPGSYSRRLMPEGRRVTLRRPYGRVPLLVRSGSLIPFGPAIQWSDEKPADIINLYVYTGRDGQFTLYEDENVNYNYEKGALLDNPHRVERQDIDPHLGRPSGRICRNVAKPPLQHHARLHRATGGYDPAAKGIEVAYNGKAKKVRL